MTRFTEMDVIEWIERLFMIIVGEKVSSCVSSPVSFIWTGFSVKPRLQVRCLRRDNREVSDLIQRKKKGFETKSEKLSLIYYLLLSRETWSFMVPRSHRSHSPLCGSRPFNEYVEEDGFLLLQEWPLTLSFLLLSLTFGSGTLGQTLDMTVKGTFQKLVPQKRARFSCLNLDSRFHQLQSTHTGVKP